MKRTIDKLLPLLLSLILLLSAAPAALAEGDGQASPLLDQEALNQWMDAYLAEHNLQNSYQVVSVGFCYTATGECWYYNGDEFLYSASLYKVPVSMLMAEKEAAGELTQESKIPGGTLQYLESTALTYSNNDSGHAMVNYLGGNYQGKCSDMTISYTSLPEDYFEEDFFLHSYYSARYMTQILQTLYEGGEERFPHVIEYLLPAQPDGYLNLRLKGIYQVAQKYGAYTEPNGNNNNHVAAIVYTPTPIIVTVMTRNVGDYQNRMAEIGEYLANYSLELDEKRAERERPAESSAQPSPEGDAAPTAVPESREPGVEPTQLPGDAQTESIQPDQPQEGLSLLPILIIVGIGAVLAVLMLVSTQRSKRSRRRRRRSLTAAGSGRSRRS